MSTMLDYLEWEREEHDRRERFVTALAEAFCETAKQMLLEQQADDTEDACIRELLRNGAIGGGLRSGDGSR